jgi:predicted RNase H-like HicB family nuclease
MGFEDYKVVLYRQDDGAWVADIPAVGGCYALMDTKEEALAELGRVFDLIAQEHANRGQALPKDKMLRQLGISLQEFDSLR